MIWIGTSGYNYPAWKGRFYPAKLPASEMLGYYASHFSAVEINATFYRWPTEKSLLDWARGTPEGFKFALKVPRRITHFAQLRNCADLVRTFATDTSVLGTKLGPCDFRLPETLERDVPLLEALLAELPATHQWVIEFRHPSWHTDDVFELLRQYGVALCVSESDALQTPITWTANFAYLRLRREAYDDGELQQWAEVIRRFEQTMGDAYVFFRHEDLAKGPAFATRLIAALAAPSPHALDPA